MSRYYRPKEKGSWPQKREDLGRARLNVADLRDREYNASGKALSATKALENTEEDELETDLEKVAREDIK